MITILISILVLAALAALFTFYGLRRFVSHQPSADEMSAHMLRDFRADLQLTDNQVAAIEPVVAKAVWKLTALQRETATGFCCIMDDLDREVHQHLSEEQRDRFAVLKERRPNPSRTRTVRASGSEAGIVRLPKQSEEA